MQKCFDNKNVLKKKNICENYLPCKIYLIFLILEIIQLSKNNY